MNKRREIWADNAKFIGITLMLIGHNSLASNEVFDFIYAFHMPLFFILSGYFASDKREPFMPYFLSFAAGAMLYVVVEELVPEASEGEHSNIGTIGFAIGFALMMVLDVALG